MLDRPAGHALCLYCILPFGRMQYFFFSFYLFIFLSFFFLFFSAICSGDCLQNRTRCPFILQHPFPAENPSHPAAFPLHLGAAFFLLLGRFFVKPKPPPFCPLAAIFRVQPPTRQLFSPHLAAYAQTSFPYVWGKPTEFPIFRLLCLRL
ncbi:hypothetical protein [Acutalibacter caecimuris]|uniref:hypothetical protein n=1 Tax=Acutalibacter caecimuris TaxID=3093657 RepID=UPI002AC9BF3E|nr:hypothetical protein [Acutalibacter sp. M00118]